MHYLGCQDKKHEDRPQITIQPKRILIYSLSGLDFIKNQEFRPMTYQQYVQTKNELFEMIAAIFPEINIQEMNYPMNSKIVVDFSSEVPLFRVEKN